MSEEIASTQTTETAPTEGGIEITGGWNYADGTAGAGERPEWFKEKYTTVSDQAQAYNELEKRFGGFTGSPDEFTIDEGVEYDAENPLFEKLQTLARENNMNNDLFNGLISMYNEAQSEYYDMAQQMEVDALGDKAEARINNIADWGRANLPEGLSDTFLDNMRTADDIKVMEHIISLTKETKVAGDQVPLGNTQDTAESLYELQMAVDKNGDRRMSTDPEYKKFVDAKFSNFYK